MLQTYAVSLQKQPGHTFGLILEDAPGTAYTGGAIIGDIVRCRFLTVLRGGRTIDNC